MPGQWSAEQREKYEATIAARTEGTAGTVTEVPFKPAGRKPRKAGRRRGTRGKTTGPRRKHPQVVHLQGQVHAEVSVSENKVYLVIGSFRVPLKVVP